MRLSSVALLAILLCPLPSLAQQVPQPQKSCEESLREAQLSLSIADRTMEHQSSAFHQASREVRKEVVDAWGKALVRAESAERAMAQSKAVAPVSEPKASQP